MKCPDELPELDRYARTDNSASYVSSNSRIATVDGSGKITAKNAGTAVITITAAATSNYNATSSTNSAKLIGRYSHMSRGAYIAATLSDDKKKEQPSDAFWQRRNEAFLGKKHEAFWGQKNKAFWEQKNKAFWEK